MIAGLEDLTSGAIQIDGKDMTNVAPSKRGLSMVFQSYALYPHMSVRNNIAFGLKMAGMPKSRDRRQGGQGGCDAQSHRISRPQAAPIVGRPTPARRHRPRHRAQSRRLSCLTNRSPISMRHLRVNMRIEIMQMHKALGATMIYVTHDQVEAMTMADRIVVLNKGDIEQVGSPLELYNRPDSLFVAGFIGSPKMNLIQGGEAKKFDATTIGIRPEHLAISEKAGTWTAKIRLAEHLGADTFLHVDAGPCGMMTVRAEGEYAATPDAKIFLTPEPSRIHRFDKDGKAFRK